ncbi:MAG: hypothetical protein AB7U81_04635 [Thiohalomonadaceae bacterium]
MKRANDFADYRRLFETVLVIILALVFVVIAAKRIYELRITAEQVGVAHTVGALRTGLSHRVVELALQGDMGALAGLAQANPLDFLKEAPTRYVTLEGPLPPEDMLPYHWYFEPATGVLTYRVGNEDALITALPPPARIRFRVQLDYADENGNGRFDPKTDVISRLDLVPLEPYAWRTPQEDP